jgi:fluoride exporter
VLMLLVTLAAGLGALARYVVDEVVTHRTRGPFPTGTLVVNITGSFVLGVVTGLALHHGLAGDVTTVIGAGFAGGYTTFSTWAWESLALAEDGIRGAAAVNVVGSIFAGLAAAAAGLGLALL